jgi:hypothetical protein
MPFTSVCDTVPSMRRTSSTACSAISVMTPP